MAPTPVRSAESGDLGYRAGRERVDDLGRESLSGSGAGLMVDSPGLLGALPGDEEFAATWVGADGLVEPVPLPVGEPVGAAPENVSDLVERVVVAPSVAVNLLLDPAADLVDRVAAKFHYVEGVQHCGGILELIIDDALVAVERVQGRHFDASAESAPRSLSQSR